LDNALVLHIIVTGIGATLLLSGTLLLINRPDWQMMPAWLMAGGVVVWLAGWRKTR